MTVVRLGVVVEVIATMVVEQQHIAQVQKLHRILSGLWVLFGASGYLRRLVLTSDYVFLKANCHRSYFILALKDPCPGKMLLYYAYQ